MRMQIEMTKKVTEEVEIEFPIFLLHIIDHEDGASTEIHTRIDQDGDGIVEHSVTIRHNWDRRKEFEIEIERTRTLSTGSDADYTLGRGEYAGSAKEFSDAVASMMAAAQEIAEVAHV